ncbi:hypothetical protein DSO57_1019132 [Entomophthora muscae]|uniref:Uncharacterized protein n=1 Tax=Entomophthora muscae TaxID=34485 RepID=A0ACC2RIW5_9FUNG|nr:hypothetical protein DSO57_1019132 [Entomophthora muscae]
MHIELIETGSTGFKDSFSAYQRCDYKQPPPRFTGGQRGSRKSPKPPSTKLSWEDVQNYFILQSGTLLRFIPSFFSNSYFQAVTFLDAYPSLVGFTYPFCFILSLVLFFFFCYCLISGSITLSIALFGWLLMHSFLTTSSFMIAVLPIMTITFWGCVFSGIAYYLYSLFFETGPKK